MGAVVLEQFLQIVDPSLVQLPAAVYQFDPLVEDHNFLYSLHVAFFLRSFHFFDLCSNFTLHCFFDGQVAELLVNY
jgi:hypothetical protein